MINKVTVTQNTAAPTRKVTGFTIGGVVASLAMGCLAIFYPEAYSRVPPGFEGGIATGIGLLLAYFVKELA